YSVWSAVEKSVLQTQRALAAERIAEAPASTDGAELKLQGQSLVLTPVASSGLLAITSNSLNRIVGDIEEQADVAHAKCATPNKLRQQPPAGPMLPNAPRGEGCGEGSEQHANPEQSPRQIRTLLEAQTKRVPVAH